MRQRCCQVVTWIQLWNHANGLLVLKPPFPVTCIFPHNTILSMSYLWRLLTCAPNRSSAFVKYRTEILGQLNGIFNVYFRHTMDAFLSFFEKVTMKWPNTLVCTKLQQRGSQLRYNTWGSLITNMEQALYDVNGSHFVTLSLRNIKLKIFWLL